MSYEFFPIVYDELMDAELYDEWADFARQVLPQAKGALLDLASGTGEFAIRMHFLGYDVTGLDLSAEMVRVSQDKINAINLPISFQKKIWPIFHPKSALMLSPVFAIPLTI
ncbi:ubiquinone/menaquinone biosynthesis methyltransferase [Listeria fleischmannii subsp. fleischmannii]|uniref:Ubiquinone/menaquinone biosynthesis methyltransferase n=1 Tax=Listeria fleischmannii subsp. fleischmannii TaxID=1671902 RepID=A0A2X3HBH2_9LIST|nr:ubiquinone/menaquinone biosynthesis methyltransferase [Listeria fleischmannii subsp. fleischmannii]